jgi:Ca-activated chloride channel family protein
MELQSFVVRLLGMKTLVSFLLLVLALASQTFADGLIVIHNPPPWHPYPHSSRWSPPPRHYEFAPLEVVYHHVSVKIDGQIATTAVDQEFYNPNSERLDGTYLFPVPKGAQIDKFSMEIGGKKVEAELLPADTDCG